MKIAAIKTCDIENSPGLTVSLWVQGCPHRCEDCWNKETWAFNDGKDYTQIHEDIILKEMKKGYSLSILGGEPLQTRNKKDLINLCRKAKEKYPDKTIWLWTGYIFEDIIKEFKDLFKYVDVVVDGKYDKNKRVDKYNIQNSDDLYRGSTNQRVINVKNFNF